MDDARPWPGAFKAILQRLEPLVSTVTWGEFLEFRAFQYVINRWAADAEVLRQLHYLPQPGLIKPPDFLPIH